MLAAAMARKPIVIAVEMPVTDQPVSCDIGRRKTGNENMAPIATQPKQAARRDDHPAIGMVHELLARRSTPWSFGQPARHPKDGSEPPVPTSGCILVGAFVESALRRLPVGRWNDVDHPRDAELVDQRAEAGRPEGLAERHDRLAAFRQLIEPALALGHCPRCAG